MSKQNSEILYTLNQRPPASTLILLSFQHIFLMSSTLILPVMLFSEVTTSLREISSIVATTMITAGIGTILQALGKFGIGSGYLCPSLCGPNFFVAAANTVWLSGLPLLRGMVLIAGLTEVVFSRCFHWLKFLFPPEINGLVVFMIALSLIPVGTSKFIGLEYEGGVITPINALISTVTLIIMLASNIMGGPRWKLYSLLIGLITGYGLCFATDTLANKDICSILQAPWFGAPELPHYSDIKFDWSLLPTFIIVSMCGALKTLANLTVCAKLNNHQDDEANVKRISQGLLSDGLTVALSGLIGSMPSDTSTSNVALSRTSGATSRAIAFSAGVLFIILGFSPKLSTVLSVIPPPVAGAILIFVTAFMIISGMQIILSTGTDPKKMLAIGASMIFGISIYITPNLYASVPNSLNPLFSSPLTLSTILAIILSQLFRLKDFKLKPDAPEKKDLDNNAD